MTYSVSELLSILPAEALALPDPVAAIEHICTDSRQVVFPGASIFFALAGRRFDGHDFVPDAYREGIRHFVISKPVDTTGLPGANVLLTRNTLQALQSLAQFHRRRFQLPVIGITGSNGKTIVKEWLFQLLHPDFTIVRSPRSYNSQLGVPLSVWAIQPEHQLGIFEAGISRPGEMDRLAPIIRCQIGLFTNIGDAHDEGFSSRREKALEKLKLFSSVETLVYCRDYPLIETEVQQLNRPVFTWSRRREADLFITGQYVDENHHTRLKASFRGAALELEAPFSDEASIENAIHCWAVLLYLGIEPSVIAARIRRLEPVAMRLELKEGINQCIVINDSYNSDLNALNIALHFLAQQSAFSRRTLILSDILQSGLEPEKLYRRVAGLLKANGIQRVIGVGRQILLLAPMLPPPIESRFFTNTDDFIAAFEQMSFQNEAILLKGARRFAFERIALRLEKKVHRTVLEVDLNALIHNLRIFQARLEAETKMMAMVKAAAYGSGSLEVARLLAYQGADYLAVAYADEGVELRRGGVQLPIMVLNPEKSAFDLMIRYNLEPELYNFRILREWLTLLLNEERLPGVHLKVDTGMHRLGFEAADLPELVSLLKENPSLKVRSIFTHLAASEASEHDDFTRRQINVFSTVYQQLAEALGYRPLRHVLNSGGIVRFPQYQFDMVRLGIGLYGVDAGASLQERLRRVLRLRASISQIKTVADGETIGYGRRGVVEKSMRMATVSIGYADGLPRSAGNGRYQLNVGGQLAPTVGSICMDMCMVDISRIPEAREGDAVEVFGDLPTVQDLAACENTIPYEVFTRISPRVKRIYIQE